MYFIPFFVVLLFLFIFRSNIIAIISGIFSIGIINVLWYKNISMTDFFRDLFVDHLYSIVHPTGYLFPIIFLLGVGVLIDIFYDLHILSSYKFLMQKLFYRKKTVWLSLSVIFSSLLLIFDDYLVLFGMKNFFESLYANKGNDKYKLAIYSSLLGVSIASLCISTWSGVILTQIVKLIECKKLLLCPMDIFLASKKFFFYPIVVYVFLIIRSLTEQGSQKIVSMPSDIENKHIVPVDIFLFSIFPLSIASIFFYNFCIVGVCIAESDIAYMLCQGLGIAFGLISVFLFIFKSIPFYFIVKRTMATSLQYIKPIFSMLCCWLFSKLMFTSMGSVISNIMINVPEYLIPFMYYIFSAVISCILGSEWTTISLVLPFIVVSAIQSEMLIAMNLGAVVSGAIGGCQFSPVSNTGMTASVIFEIDSILFYKKKMLYIIPIFIISSILFILVPVVLL